MVSLRINFRYETFLPYVFHEEVKISAHNRPVRVFSLMPGQNLGNICVPPLFLSSLQSELLN